MTTDREWEERQHQAALESEKPLSSPSTARLTDYRLTRLGAIADENMRRGNGFVPLLGSAETLSLVEEAQEWRAAAPHEIPVPPGVDREALDGSFLEAEIRRHTVSGNRCACGHRYVVLGFGIDYETLAAHLAHAIHDAGWRRA